ncbi:MAG: hypothetical protein OXE43_14410 [Chloroflexi bacterium]|nr:hypothetical protein [Chloroflexota bacterium]
MGRAYYVFENLEKERSRIHDAGCGHCVRAVAVQARQALPGRSHWHGPFPTYDEARQQATGLGLPVEDATCCVGRR